MGVRGARLERRAAGAAGAGSGLARPVAVRGMRCWSTTCRSSTLLLALYAAGGGVLLRGGFAGTPAGNTAMLALGMAMGVVMGTTGASMVLIHPLLRANAHRRRKVHLVLFLIVLVANASGALTPLGNPPLYIGLLHGVPFFWPARHLLAPLLVVTGALLTAFYLIDRHLAAGEPPPPRPERFRIRGWGNIGADPVGDPRRAGQGFLPPRAIGAAGPAGRGGTAWRRRGPAGGHR